MQCMATLRVESCSLLQGPPGRVVIAQGALSLVIKGGVVLIPTGLPTADEHVASMAGMLRAIALTAGASAAGIPSSTQFHA